MPAQIRTSRVWLATFAACVAAGLLLAASMPPWGFWPLGFAGIFVLDQVLADRQWAAHFRRGWLVSFALFAPTLWWIHDLTLPGYFVAIVVFAAMFGLCLMIVPPGVGRRVALPGAWVLAEQWKGGYPFGGVPISNLAIGQVGGPLAPVMRLFGWSFLTMLVVIGGIALSCLFDLVMAYLKPSLTARGDAAQAPAGAAEPHETRIGEAGLGKATKEPQTTPSVTAPAGAAEPHETRIGEAGLGKATKEPQTTPSVTAPAGAAEPHDTRMREAPTRRRSRRGEEQHSRSGPPRPGPRTRTSVTGLALGIIVIGGSLAGAAAAPRGHAVGHRLRVAVVQGGGPQGTRAINTDMDVVFKRHLDASDAVRPPVDLVLWPEDVVDVSSDDPDAAPVDISATAKGAALSALAERLHTSLIAGVVQDSAPHRFLNFAIAYGPDGRELGRYEKVHRVPFGEYVPLRSLIEQFAGPDLTGRDAVIGRGPAVLHTPGTTWGVAISWEIFFAHRARSAIGDGGEVLLNPTNGSTYTGTLVQTQQVASSRMRAIEEGRWVLQAAPTGFSAIIDANGHVLQRTGIGEPRVLQGTVQPRQGLTLYNRLGEWPMLATAVVLILLGWWLDGLAKRTRRRV